MAILRGTIGALIVGLVLLTGILVARSELLDPSRAGAEARQRDAETAARLDQNAFDQGVRQIELQKRRDLAEIERNQAIAEATHHLEWERMLVRLGDQVGGFVVVVLVIALLILSLALAVNLALPALVQYRQHQTSAPAGRARSPLGPGGQTVK